MGDGGARRNPTKKLSFAVQLLAISIGLLLTTINILYHSFGVNILENESPLNTPATLEFKTRGAFSRREHSNIAIFYNVYMPLELEKHEHAESIVKEQLQQVARSYAASKYPLRIHFNTIGHPRAIRTVLQACEESKLTCQPLKHYENGRFEDVTLTELYNHCQINLTDTVVYLHSKGTYHPSEMNNHWRRYMTRSALSRDCVENLSHSQSSQGECNACGFNFNPIWTPAFFGNIWTAQCSYIERLMPPLAFKQQADPTADLAMALMRQGRFSMNLLTPYLAEAGHLGRARFADEHWVGSHPQLRPCDMAPHPHLMKWIHPSFDRIRMPLKWSMAPRRPIDDDWIFVGGKDQKIKMIRDVDWRAREFFLLPGAIWKWLTWYNELPPESSYVWDWFPDGKEWLELFREMNKSPTAMKRFLEQDPLLLRNDTSVAQFAMATATANNHSLALEKPTGRRFIAHLQIPPDNLLIEGFVATVQDRLSGIARGSPGATVWYVTSGRGSVIDHGLISSSCREYNLDCHHLEHIDAGMDISTMTRVYNYCESNPYSRVGYTHVSEESLQGSRHRRSQEQTELIADQCWNTPAENCHICARKPSVIAGQPEPIPSIWLASCAHVTQLKPPNEFAAQMSETRWALGKSFGKRWIMSSRNVERCQVRQDSTHFERSSSPGQYVDLSAPRSVLTPLNSWVPTR